MIEKYNALKFVKIVHEYLDNALNEKESKDFIKTVHNNPALAQILNEERNLRTTMKNQLQRHKVDKDFIESIKGKLY